MHDGRLLGAAPTSQLRSAPVDDYFFALDRSIKIFQFVGSSFKLKCTAAGVERYINGEFRFSFGNVS